MSGISCLPSFGFFFFFRVDPSLFVQCINLPIYRIDVEVRGTFYSHQS